MIEMQDYSDKIGGVEELTLAEKLKEVFSLKGLPNVAIVKNEKNKFGNFMDVVGYERIPFFARYDLETNQLIYKTSQENHGGLFFPLSIRDQGGLYGFFIESQDTANDFIKSKILSSQEIFKL